MPAKDIDKRRAQQRKRAKTPQAKELRKKWLRTPAGQKYKARAARNRCSRTRLWLDEIKLKTGCIDCGYNKWPEALDFDHKNRKSKVFNISQKLNMCKNFLLKEIRKCVVRCANCHRHRSKKENPNGFRKNTN
jgi:hypothetical protein